MQKRCVQQQRLQWLGNVTRLSLPGYCGVNPFVAARRLCCWPLLLGIGAFAYRRRLGEFFDEVIKLVPSIKSGRVAGLEVSIEKVVQVKEERVIAETDLLQAEGQLSKATTDVERAMYEAKIQSLEREVATLKEIEQKYQAQLGDAVLYSNAHRISHIRETHPPSIPYGPSKQHIMSRLVEAIGPQWIWERAIRNETSKILERFSDVIADAYDGRLAEKHQLDGNAVAGLRRTGMVDASGRSLTEIGYSELVRLSKVMGAK